MFPRPKLRKVVKEKKCFICRVFYVGMSTLFILNFGYFLGVGHFVIRPKKCIKTVNAREGTFIFKKKQKGDFFDFSPLWFLSAL